MLGNLRAAAAVKALRAELEPAVASGEIGPSEAARRLLQAYLAPSDDPERGT